MYLNGYSVKPDGLTYATKSLFELDKYFNLFYGFIQTGNKPPEYKQDISDLGAYILYARFLYIINNYRTHWIWSVSYIPYVNLLYRLHSLSFLYGRGPSFDYLKTLPMKTYSVEHDDFKTSLLKDLNSLIRSLFIETHDAYGIPVKSFTNGIAAILPHRHTAIPDYYYSKTPNNPPLSKFGYLVDAFLIHIAGLSEMPHVATKVDKLSDNKTIRNIETIVRELLRIFEGSNRSGGLIVTFQSIEHYCLAIYDDLKKSPDTVPKISKVLPAIPHFSRFIHLVDKYLKEYCKLIHEIKKYLASFDSEIESNRKRPFLNAITKNIKSRYDSSTGTWKRPPSSQTLHSNRNHKP